MKINLKTLFTTFFLLFRITLFLVFETHDSFSMVCFSFAIDVTILHVIRTLKETWINDESNQIVWTMMTKMCVRVWMNEWMNVRFGSTNNFYDRKKSKNRFVLIWLLFAQTKWCTVDITKNISFQADNQPMVIDP